MSVVLVLSSDIKDYFYAFCSVKISVKLFLVDLFFHSGAKLFSIKWFKIAGKASKKVIKRSLAEKKRCCSIYVEVEERNFKNVLFHSICFDFSLKYTVLVLSRSRCSLV